MVEVTDIGKQYKFLQYCKNYYRKMFYITSYSLNLLCKFSTKFGLAMVFMWTPVKYWVSNLSHLPKISTFVFLVNLPFLQFCQSCNILPSFFDISEKSIKFYQFYSYSPTNIYVLCTNFKATTSLVRLYSCQYINF